MTKWGIAPWWKYVFGILMMVTLITALAYAIGAGGFRARGAAVTIDRSVDSQLLKLNPRVVKKKSRSKNFKRDSCDYLILFAYGNLRSLRMRIHLRCVIILQR